MGKRIVQPAALAVFRAAASFLARDDVRCPVHRVAHTGKLARAVLLDLALLDHTGEAPYWERAVTRARWVAGRLAPDPQHGALIYHPGRLDPRNCSTSAIDSGECTDALALLLRHERAATLDDGTRGRLEVAVERNAETYLQTAVIEKGITNQRLWAAMGLASAWPLVGRDTWLDPLARSVDLALGEQRADGSWGYQPRAVKEGAHLGAADLTVYYHSRCIVFLQHIAGHVPALNTATVRDAIERGLDFLTLVITPDGLKPLTLEGKRWFWDGTYEAGSAAYDVFALLRGAAVRAERRSSALAAWRQLARHQRWDGAIVACREPGNADFVCPDFHTADLAWTAQAMGELPDPLAPTQPAALEPGERRALSAGVIRIDGPDRAVLIRAKKQPANTQFGSLVGGGTLAAVVDGGGRRLLLPHEARCVLYPRASPTSAIAGLRHFLRANRPRREGTQLIFAARLLARQGRYAAAVRRLWKLWLAPLLASFRDPAGPDWATDGHRVSRLDGTVPRWAEALSVHRECRIETEGVHVRLLLTGGGSEVGSIEYVVPASARAVQVEGDGVEFVRRGSRVTARVAAGTVRVDVTYVL